MSSIELEQTEFDHPDIVRMKVDLDITMEKEELKKFKKLRIRERMVKDFEQSNLWSHVYFIVLDGERVGFVSMLESSFYENLVWLSELYIVEKYRGKKIGSNALSMAKSIASDRGFDYFGVRFEGDKRRKFYNKNGFNSEMSCVYVAEVV